MITLEKLIIHILDSELQLPVLSEQIHPYDKEIEEFIVQHIEKTLEDEGSRLCEFIKDENPIFDLCLGLTENTDYFSQYSKDIASHLYEIMRKNPDIPSADLVIVLCKIEGVYHLALLKLNYKTSFIHYVEPSEEGQLNSIIKQKTALPTDKQKIDEAAIINLENFQIRLIEKRYEVDGAKEYYFSNRFLRCIGEMSNKDKLRVFKRVSDQMNKEYFGDDVEKKADVKKAVQDCIMESGEIIVEEVATKAFGANIEMQKKFVENLQEKGIATPTIEVAEKTAERNFQRQKIKTDSGIELNIPIDFYRDHNKLEFINNPDGTISILIKNVNKIIGS